MRDRERETRLQYKAYSVEVSTLSFNLNEEFIKFHKHAN